MILPDLRSASKMEPMSHELSEIFLKASIQEMSGDYVEVFNAEDADILGFAGQILHKRLEVMSPNTQISIGTAVIALMQSGGVPGRVVMWAYTLHRMFHETGKVVRIEDLANAFPIGFPSDNAAMEIWNQQKVNDGGYSDNMLDRAEGWLVETPA